MDSSDIMESNNMLHDAIIEGDVELVRKLLQSDKGVNKADNRFNGRTALHLAALRGRVDLINLLLLHGADVAACDNHGNTALHWCGHEDCIEMLVDHGANVLQRNHRGMTPKAMAERKGVSNGVYSLLCQLEEDALLNGEHPEALLEQPLAQSHSRFSTIFSKQTAPLWQELACDMGWRNFLLLVLGLFGFSLYFAYILTGLNLEKQVRIPIDDNADSFMIQSW